MPNPESQRGAFNSSWFWGILLLIFALAALYLLNSHKSEPEVSSSGEPGGSYPEIQYVDNAQQEEPQRTATHPTTPVESPGLTRSHPAPAKPSPHPTKSVPAPSLSKRYAIQMYSYKDERRAREMMENLKKKNISAYLMKSDSKEKGTLYRIWTGDFASHKDAQGALPEIKNVVPDSFIIEK